MAALHAAWPCGRPSSAIGFKIKVLDCVIGRRRITIQPFPSGLAKTIISKPIGNQAIAPTGATSLMFVGVPAIRVGVRMLVGVGGGVHLNPAVLKGIYSIGDLRQEIEFVGDDDIADI
jgi:hypothetical protein